MLVQEEASIENQEDSEDRSSSQKALTLVNIKKYLSEYTGFTDTEYYNDIQRKMDMLDAQTFDDLDDTRLIWENCIADLTRDYRVPSTISKSTAFGNPNNNVNKFFGNVFGTKLRQFTNVMAKYFSGINSMIIHLTI